MNRPGLKVSFRRGYYARDSLVPFDREAFITYSRIAAAGAYREEEAKNLRFRATARQDTSSPENPEIQIDLLVEPSNVSFRPWETCIKENCRSPFSMEIPGAATSAIRGKSWK